MESSVESVCPIQNGRALTQHDRHDDATSLTWFYFPGPLFQRAVANHTNTQVRIRRCRAPDHLRSPRALGVGGALCPAEPKNRAKGIRTADQSKRGGTSAAPLSRTRRGPQDEECRRRNASPALPARGSGAQRFPGNGRRLTTYDKHESGVRSTLRCKR